MARDTKRLRTPGQAVFDLMTTTASLAVLFLTVIAVLWIGPSLAMAQIVGNL